jgi:hypothetical protein
MFKSVKLFLSNGENNEIMVASRSDIQQNIGSTLVLDIDNSKLLDNYIKGESLNVRLAYVLRSNLKTEVNLRAALSFVSAPNNP